MRAHGDPEMDCAWKSRTPPRYPVGGVLASEFWQGHDGAMPLDTRLAAAGSLVAAMALTGANVGFGKVIVAAVPVYLFVFFRFLVASAALLLVVRGEDGPRLGAMT